jgi:hypothetical protein
MIGAIDEAKGKPKVGPPAAPAEPDLKTEAKAVPNPAAESLAKSTPEPHPNSGTKPQPKVEHAADTHES